MLRGRILNKFIEFMRKTFVYTSHVDVYAWFPDGPVKEVSQGDGIYYQPCINPEGTHVVYHGGALGDIYRVWKADINTCDVVPLTPSDSAAWHPVFSWDGKKIVFSSDLLSGQAPACIKKRPFHGIVPKNHIVNLFIMDSEGGSVQKITTGPYQDQRPTFSPDGKQIAFVSNRSGPIRIWTVPADSSEEPRPVQEQGTGFRPWYSADSKWIFFFTWLPNRRRQIQKIPSAGGKALPLPFDDRGRSAAPFVDPGGECLLMHSIRLKSWSIYEFAFDGTPPRELMPPGFSVAFHPTRSKNGIIAFDVISSNYRFVGKKGHKIATILRRLVYRYLKIDE